LIMGKDPAFLFYPNDYLGGTMGMTFEEKGAYMELLMMQFNRGHMTEHMIGQTVGQIWGRIQCKFKQDEQGMYYNERLEREVEKRQNYVDSRRNNKLGVNQYTNQNRSYDQTYDHEVTSHMTGHMENRNRNDNDTKDSGGAGGERTVEQDGLLVQQELPEIPKPVSKKSLPTLEEVRTYCLLRSNHVDPEKFFNHYTSNGWMVGKNKMKDWQAAVRTWEKNDSSNSVLQTQQAKVMKRDFSSIPTVARREEE